MYVFIMAKIAILRMGAKTLGGAKFTLLEVGANDKGGGGHGGGVGCTTMNATKRKAHIEISSGLTQGFILNVI